MASREAPSSDLWVVDSFSSISLTPHRDDFDTYDDYDCEINGVGSARAVGRGIVTKTMVEENGRTSTISFECLHLPSVAARVLSEPALRSQNHYFNPRKACIEFSDGRVAPLDSDENFLGLRLTAPDPEAPPVSSAPLALWHERLAHADYRTAKAAIQMVDGARLSNNAIPGGLCDPCLRAKMTRLPFPKEARKADNAGELFHVDFQGPLPVPSRQGNRHKLLLVDDYSGFAFLYHVQRKSEARHALGQFIVDSGIDPRNVRLRADNAGELSAAARELGFPDPELTCADTPEQNGRAERHLATNNSDTIALLSWAGLPDEFWEDASLHAVRVRNRLPSAGEKVTKYELWYKSRPNIAHLRVFGCVAYVLIPKGRREGKLSNRGEPRVHLGFAANHKGYLLLDPVTMVETAARHVRFDETRPGGPLVQEREADDVEDPDYVASDGTDTPVTTATHLNTTGDINVRRSGRSRSKPSEFWHVSHAALHTDAPAPATPRTYAEAMRSAEAAQWDTAVQRELHQMWEGGVWEECEATEAETRPIATTWRFKVKESANGELLFKARLCACGNQQDPSSYGETFAPSAPLHLSRVFTALSMVLPVVRYHIDVQGAYLHAPIAENVYIRPPPGLNVPRTRLLRLRKSLYGTHQANRNWVVYHSEGLRNAGYIPLLSEPCVFTRHVGDDWLVSQVHTDDADVLATSTELLQHYIDTLNLIAKVGSCEPLTSFCGCDFTTPLNGADGVLVHQQRYIDAKLRQYSMDETRPRTTPAEPLLLTKATDDDEPLPPKAAESYRSIVGALQWPARNSRPDICFAVNQLARFNNCPSATHLRAANQVLKYLRSTPRALLFQRSATLDMHAFSDADWGSDRDDRHPYLGWAVFMCGAPVIWRTRKAGGVATSTHEAEYIAASECAQDVKYLRQLLEEMRIGIFFDSPTPLYVDNRGVKHSARALESSKRSRHVDIRFHLIRDLTEKKVIDVRWIPGTSNCADTLTKPLPASTFTRHMEALTVPLPAGHEHPR
jgi:hypothetical protein